MFLFCTAVQASEIFQIINFISCFFAVWMFSSGGFLTKVSCRKLKYDLSE